MSTSQGTLPRPSPWSELGPQQTGRMRIVGLGIDLADIDRVQQVLDRYPASPSGSSPRTSEPMPSGSPGHPAGSLARFAGKEAVMKSPVRVAPDPLAGHRDHRGRKAHRSPDGVSTAAGGESGRGRGAGEHHAHRDDGDGLRHRPRRALSGSSEPGCSTAAQSAGDNFLDPRFPAGLERGGVLVAPQRDGERGVSVFR